MLRTLEIADYGCVKHATLRLTPLHALIGPNDSGKSTLLRAIFDVGRKSPPPHGALLATTGTAAAVRLAPDKSEWHAAGVPMWTAGLPHLGHPLWRELSPIQMVRFDPDVLRQQSRLVPDGRPLALGERGEGLAGVIDALISRGDDSWSRFRSRFREHFPFSSVYLPRPSETTKTVGVRLDDGTEIPAAAMSEGMLYFLAFAALAEIRRPAIYLVEEPENGLHPSRIADIVRGLREVAEQSEGASQVIIATHSPLVINELRPEEVTVVTRTYRDGTRLTPLAETKNFAQRAKVYALGEIWLAYANGKDEAPLLGEGSAE